MKKIYVTLVVLCALVMAYLPIVAQDFEPNDDAYSAIPANLNVPINGSLIAAQNDTIDWFFVNITELGAVDIQVMPMGSLDPILEVYKSDDGGLTQYLLESKDNGGINFAETISNPKVDPGLYYIVVKAKSGDGNYMLNINFTADQTGGSTDFVLDDFEDGDNINNLLTTWYTYTDTQQGGGSAIAYGIELGMDGKSLQANYILNKGTLTYDPFVLMATSLNQFNDIVDLRGSTGISFTYQGNAINFDVIDDISVLSENYQVAIPYSDVPTTYTILWDDLSQPTWATSKYPFDLSRITSFQWRAQSNDGEIGVINIDNIKILNYQPVLNQDSVEVIFSVNMQNQIVSANGVHLIGSFVDWTANKAVIMQNTGNNIYTATIKLKSGDAIQYKFVNGLGSDYSAYEVLSGQPCANPQFENRFFSVPTVNEILPTVCFASCTNCTIANNVPVSISTNVTSGSSPLLVQFMGNSPVPGSIVEWNWDFGDGQVGFGPNPGHTYSVEGVYTATLSVIDDKGMTGVATTTITVNPEGSLSPTITVDRNSGYVPFTSNFSGTCTGNIVNWVWNFGDGTNASGQNVSHSFTEPGNYVVTLYVQDDTGNTSSYFIYVTGTQSSTMLKTEFWANNYSNYAPFTVNFGDYSDGSPTEWNWDFDNDGVIDSYEQNPTYTYQTPGTYSVKLSIKNAVGQIDELTKTDFITVWQQQQIDPYCDNAVPAILGTNYLDFATAETNDFGRKITWYSYTATSNKLLKIDLCNNGYLNWQEIYDIYTDCNGTYSNEVKMKYCNSAMSSTLPVNAGQTIYFSVVSEGNVNGEQGLTFTLTELPILPGTICSTAKSVNLGVNNASTLNGDEWFLFKPSQSGYYEISSCGKTTLDTDVEIYQSCSPYYWLSGSNECGLQSKVFFHAAMNDDIFIAWRDYNSQGQFPWEIKYLGAELVYPEFSTNTTSGVGSLQVYFYNSSINALSYAWDFNNDGNIDSNQENPNFTFTQPGLYTVKLQITGYEGGNLVTKSVVKPNYILVQQPQVGTYCQVAKPTVIGANTMNVIDGNMQWFKYSSDFTGKLIVNTCNSNYPMQMYINDIYEGCANNSIYGQSAMCGNKANQSIPVESGKDYYFALSVYEYIQDITSISFELIKQLPQPGELCSLPIVLQGTSSIQTIQNPLGAQGYTNIETWYSYTAPSNGIIELNTCINQDLGYLYSNLMSSCNMNSSNNYIDYRYKSCSSSSNNSEIKIVQVEKDQTILIRMDGQVNQLAQWQFMFRDFYTGEVCTKPLIAKQGLNSIPSGLDNSFYTFTASDNGVVTISNCEFAGIVEGGFSGVQIKSSCDTETAEIIQYGVNNCGVSNGANIAFQVETGKTYIIEWYTKVQNWNLEFIKDAVMPPGYTCQNPYVITQEQNVIQPTGNITWFEVSFPESGTAMLTSDLQVEGYVFLHDECTPLTEDMKMNVPYVMNDTAIIFWPVANKKYKLVTIFSEQVPTQPFNFGAKLISDQPQPANVVCNDAKPLTLGVQQTTTKYNTYWYSYTAKANTIVHIDFDDQLYQQMQVSAQIFLECPSPFDHYSEYGHNYYEPCGSNLNGVSMQINSDTTLYIKFKSKTETATFDWTMREYAMNSVNLISFASMQQVTNAIINNTTKTINLTVAQSASITETTVDFKVSPGATVIAAPYNNTLCPNNQLYFQNGQSAIRITSADGTQSQDWNVTITKSMLPNNKADILGLYSSALKNVAINPTNYTVTATVKYFARDCYQMNMQISAGAFTQNPSFEQCLSENSYIRQLQITAEDGTTVRTWTINFVREQAPVGADCDNFAAAEKGYNSIPFAEMQTSYFMEYTMQNNGTFEIDACSDYDEKIGAYIILDCETIDETALYSNCNDPMYASKGQKEYIKGQKVKLVVFRENNTEYSNYMHVTIREIPSVITNYSVSPAMPTVYLGDTICFNLQVLPMQSFITSIASSTTGTILQKHTNVCYIAKQLGSQNVVFTTTDGSNITKTVSVQVVAKPILVSQIVIPSSLTLTVGQVSTIPAIISPSNASNKGVTWTVSNTAIASIDPYGTIEAKGVGNVTVTATSIDAARIVSNTCAITIQGVDATGIAVNKTALTLKVGEVFTGLQATVLPINATDKSVTWTSSNPSVVTIVNNTLYAFSTGTSVVTIALVANQTIKATVNVTVSSNAVVVDKTELAAKISQHENTIAAIISQNLVGNNSGQYPQTAIDACNAVLADANFINTSQTATQEQVNQMILDIEQAIKNLQESRIDKILIAYLNIKRELIPCVKGEQKQLLVEILPTNATFTELNFTSNNAQIASVSPSGLITANSVGETYVYARAKDGSGKLDSVKVIVSIPLLSINLPQSISLVQGNNSKLEPVRNPIDAQIESFIWSTEDTTIATVDAFGNVKAMATGAVTVSVIETKSGKVASTVVYVQEQTIPVTGIQIVRDTIVIALGKSEVIYPYILPYNATNQNYTWQTSNNSLQLAASGVITVLNVTSGYVYVTSDEGQYKDSVFVKVISSEPPVVQDIEVVIETGTASVEVPLQNLVHDDNTSFEYLTVSVVGSDNFTASITDGVLVIVPVNPTIPITEVIQVVITDADNQSTTVEIPVSISGTPNQAPEFDADIAVTINTGTSFAPIILQDLVNDDYTTPGNLTYEIVTPSQNFITYVANGVLEVTRIDANWVGKDSVEVKVTDASGLSTSTFIVLEVSQALNQAPILNPIPGQTYNVTTGKYPSLDLKKYVKDDYTPASAIEWAFTPNPKLLITITNGVATILSADKNWVGTTQVTFTAYDQDDLSASTIVAFTQTATGSSTWMTAPKISFSASQTVVGPGASVSFTSSMSGAESWIWEFEGLTLTPQQRIVPNPVVSYSKGGTYKVTLKAMNQYGQDSLIKDNYITVIGIDNINPIVCSGASVTLVATVPASSGYTYLWSTGATTESITIEPTANTTYSLTVFKGFFQYEDAVLLQVPVKVNLLEDRAICAGTGFTITVPNFEEYNWNNQGWGTQNSITVSQAGTTQLQVRDSYGCVTSDEFTITEVFALPTVSLGADKEVCQGTSTTLSATVTGAAPLAYKWNTLAQTQTISVNTDGNYSLEITDNNGCKASDEVAVTVLSPYKEEIGVATFAKDGNGVVIAWERTLGKRTASYEVMRETGEAGTFISIGTLPFDAEESFIEDKDADVLTKAYTYKLVTRDSTCNNAAESATHTTVVASYVVQLTGFATVQWSKYVGLPIATYRIKKGTSLNNLVQVDSIAGTSPSTWNDKVPYQYGVMYRIEMKLPDTVETRWSMLKIESGPFTLALSNIAEAKTSIETVDVTMKVYPTIATSTVTVDFDTEVSGVDIQLISSSGSVVYTTSKVSGSSFEIPVQGIAKGMYTVKVIANSQVQTIPIVVQ